MDSSNVDLSELMSLVEKERIRELLARWSRASDRADDAGIAACYLENSVDSHGPFLGTGKEFAERPLRHSDAVISTTHFLGQSIIDLDGDKAYCETYFLCPEVRKFDGDALYIQIMGRYLDVVRKVSGLWLIESRRVVLDWASEESANAWRALDGFPRSQPWPDDEIYNKEPHEWPGYRPWVRH
jgi:ketosteroid isomerase-like protein